MKKDLLWIIPVLFLSCPAILHSESAVDYIANGNKLANKKQYKEAIEQYQKAFKMDPKNNRAILLISLCYVQAGDLDKGLSYAQLLSQQDPTYASFYNLGLIYSVRKESDKALDSFDRALKLNPKSFDAEYQKGLVYTNIGKYDHAISFFQKALALNPSMDKVRLALFNAFLKQGDRDSALAQIEEFRKMKKNAIVQALKARLNE